MPRGGWRSNSGRKPGSKNKRPHIRLNATGLAEFAQQYTPEATMALVDIMRHGKSEHARISAAVHLMDRGHGRIPQGLFDDPRDSVRSEVVDRTPEEIFESIKRLRLPWRRMLPMFIQLGREKGIPLGRQEGLHYEDEIDQNSQNGQPPQGAEERSESDS